MSRQTVGSLCTQPGFCELNEYRFAPKTLPEYLHSCCLIVPRTTILLYYICAHHMGGMNLCDVGPRWQLVGGFLALTFISGCVKLPVRTDCAHMCQRQCDVCDTVAIRLRHVLLFLLRNAIRNPAFARQRYRAMSRSCVMYFRWMAYSCRSRLRYMIRRSRRTACRVYISQRNRQ